jgi:hypothetical protein
MERDPGAGDQVRRASPSGPRRPAGVSRLGRGLRIGFRARLGLTLGLTLALVMGVTYVAMTRVLERRVIAQEAVYQRA